MDDIFLMKIKKNKMIKKIIIWIKYVQMNCWAILGKSKRINIQKICFFYLPVVPDFGSDFLYFKLGEKEKIENPNNFDVLFEADLPINISNQNKVFLDYSGLYALYKNRLINKDYVLIIHYDAIVSHPKWKDIINLFVGKHSVVFSTWPPKGSESAVSKWVKNNIDDIFVESGKDRYYDIINMAKYKRIPNSSQFACKKETFYELLDYLLPLYGVISEKENKNMLYAHILERAWGLFWANNGYEVIPVIRDRHSQDKNYNQFAKTEELK